MVSCPIHEEISALVLQLPPSLSFKEAKPRLEELFKMLPDDFAYPIEGRHESWFSGKAIKFLRESRHCLVWNEVEGADNPVPITANLIYLRLIVDRTIRNSEFGKATKNKDGQIAGWAKKKFKRLKMSHLES